MIRQYELVESVKAYDPRANEDALNRAYVFAMKAHGAQKRASGDPYFSHPLEVAGILTKFKLDSTSIVTALLHDTIEDTDVTAEEIEDHFGDEVSRLVQGVTKLTQIELQTDGANQAENFRKLVLAMSEDIRVLIVKLADRLHNMRTLRFIGDPEKRRQIALETMEIYAPLAERIGFEEMKSELEELAFAELNSEARDSIIQRLKFLREQGSDMVSRISEQLRETLAKAKVRAQVNGREKQPYSIWVKTQRKNIAFEQLSDIVAFRVIVDQVEDCYRAIGVIHLAYSVVPGRFKDYISTPKPNGYKSIHTAVIGPEKQRIEIQVRTREMHEVADLGVAAHWRYKIETEKVDGRQYRWMRELLDILDQAAGPEDFLEHTKLEMFANQVFCFTPKGDAITLPEGATPVDFAYAVHSEIGDTCVGCKINGKIMPLRAQLHNGDQVEIITSKAQTPLPMWENFVATGKARARIRRFIRQRERAEYINLGVAILERAFADAGYGLTDKALEQAVPKFRDATVDDLKAEVGAGHLTGIDVVEAVYPEIKKNRESRSFFGLGRRGTKSKAKDRAKNKGKNGKGHKDSVPIKGLIPGMAVHFAICCHPLPGDRIVGIVTKGRGVTIHTIDCESLEDFAEMPERWLDVSWDADAADSELRVGRLVVTVTNEPGSLGDCSTVIAKNGGNISNLKIVNRAVQFFDLAIDIEVQDLKHLTNIVGALRATPAIIAVERARG